MINYLSVSMEKGFRETTMRLMDLDGIASNGFADVRAALERSDESIREGVNELHEALIASELKLARLLDKATLTNLEVVKGVKAELGFLSNRLEALPLESLDSMCEVIDEIKKDIEKNAKSAKDDQEALREVLSDAAIAVQVISLKVDALQAQVIELGIKFAKQSETIVQQIREGNEATKIAQVHAQNIFEAALEQALKNSAAVSVEALQATLQSQCKELMHVIGDVHAEHKDEVDRAY